jgi:hypothetical protein
MELKIAPTNFDEMGLEPFCTHLHLLFKFGDEGSSALSLYFAQIKMPSCLTLILSLTLISSRVFQ